MQLLSSIPFSQIRHIYSSGGIGPTEAILFIAFSSADRNTIAEKNLPLERSFMSSSAPPEITPLNQIQSAKREWIGSLEFALEIMKIYKAGLYAEGNAINIK